MPENKLDLLNNDFIEQYDDRLNSYFHQIVMIQTSYKIFTKMVKSEINIFPLNSDNAFFNVTMNNYYEYLIISLFKLLDDNGKDVMTILKFKNQVVENIKSGKSAAFKKRLKSLKNKEDEIKGKIKKLTQLRSKRIAHDVFEKNTEIYKLTITDIDILIKYSISLFNILALDQNYMLVLPEYNNDNLKTDIDNIMTQSIINSPKFIKKYVEIENNNSLLDNLRLNFPDRLNEINIIRKKYGYSEI